jgi:hypothetical protein
MDRQIVAHDARHYDPEADGSWDGQLPHPDIAHGAGPAVQDGSAGTLLNRWQWVFNAVQSHQLTGSQGLVLSRIAFRAGTPPYRCMESQKNIATALAMNEDTVRRAVRDLERKGLVTFERRFNSPGYIYPSFKPIPSETGD